MKIAIIEDHQLISESLNAYLLKSGLAKEVRSFRNGDYFLNRLEINWVPDIILTDLLMVGTAGMELLKALGKSTLKHKIHPKIIVISSVEDPQTIKMSFRLGATGYIGKSATLEELSEGIKTVLKGNTYICHDLQKIVVNHLISDNESTLLLSPRENELLNMICDGVTLKEAAYNLNLSLHTVRNYYRSIMKKFNVHRSVDLIKFAIEKGIYFPKTFKS